MIWKEIEETLKRWFLRSTGVEAVIWKDQAGQFPKRPYGELAISAVRNVGTDERRETYDSTQPEGKQIVREVVGQRLFTLGCRVRSRDNRPGKHALAYLEKARTSLASTWVLDLLKSADLSFIEAGPSVPLPGDFDDRQESYELMEVTLGGSVCVTDPLDQGTYINTILVTSNIVDASGESILASLQLDDEEMP